MTFVAVKFTVIEKGDIADYILVTGAADHSVISCKASHWCRL